jgi:uncharacterized membrane protein
MPSRCVRGRPFALHYAHGYYGDADPSGEYKRTGGLGFPGTPEPDYWDFMYFSFVVGMTFQVSDVQIEDRNLRRVIADQEPSGSSKTGGPWRRCKARP